MDPVIVAILLVFFLGYLGIVLEHVVGIDKTAPALFAGMTSWAILAIFGTDSQVIETIGSHAAHAADGHGWLRPFVEHELTHHLFEISNILFFLIGAMTIVEVIDLHDGFTLITNRINTRSKSGLMWIVAVLTFFMSALLDNLTTTIVMVSLMSKLLEDRKLRLLYAGIIVISANAGGAWSPIGDVTTTMLWIKGQISAGSVIVWLIVPSLVCMVVPCLILSRSADMRGPLVVKPPEMDLVTSLAERRNVFVLATALLLFVPVFKTLTHLPPFMGMLFGLGILWAATEMMHKHRDPSEKSHFSLVNALSRIDAPSMLFFLGILLAVACLQSIHVLKDAAAWLDSAIGNYDVIVFIIGLLSAIVDNVPLVAASQGMYPINETNEFMMDGKFWQFLAYCAGTGGSVLIIGSAAGVAAMGIERIDFMWYLKRMGYLALSGYVAGAVVYLAMYALIQG